MRLYPSLSGLAPLSSGRPGEVTPPGIRQSVPVNPSPLSTEQYDAHARACDQLADLHDVIRMTLPSCKVDDAGFKASPVSDTGSRQAMVSSGNAHWWRWSAALLGATATQGALETFLGRLAQEGVRVISGHPEQAEDVSDRWIVAHAAVNIATGVIAAGRAGLHVYRALGNPGAYAQGLRGEHSVTLLPSFAAAGTPCVPATQLIRLSAGMGVALATFMAASHTGVVALTHTGSLSVTKAQAYNALVKSNGNTACCYVREGVNLCSRALGLISHEAMVSPRGVIVSTSQYLLNSVGQELARSSLPPPRDDRIDLLWPCVSAAAEFVDVGCIAASARLAEPDRPVSLLGGRLHERAPQEPLHPPVQSLAQAADRLTQRAVGRQLVAEMTRIVPYEAGALLRPYVGNTADTAANWSASVLAAATHLREPLWQAERVAQTMRR